MAERSRPHKRRLPENVTAYVDRHGKERFRFRKTGFKAHAFKAPFGTAEFDLEYEQAVGARVKPGADRAIPGSVDDLIGRFYQTVTFSNAGAEKQQSNRGIIESFRAEFGAFPVKDFGFSDVEAILKKRSVKRQVGRRMVGGPVAARNLHKQIKRLFRFALKLEWIKTNPADLAEAVKAPKTGGYHTWTEEEIAQYQARHPLGTKARLALEIILWTGQRRGDARSFGPKHIKDGKIAYQQAKTGKKLGLPAAPQLLAAIKAMPATGIETYLVTDYGKPFSKAGFGNKMREWCDEAGLPQCSAHGLRKAIARRSAQLGGTNQGLKAVGGWSNDAEVAVYTAEVEQAALADDTLGRVIEWDLNRGKE